MNLLQSLQRITTTATKVINPAIHKTPLFPFAAPPINRATLVSAGAAPLLFAAPLLLPLISLEGKLPVPCPVVDVSNPVFPPAARDTAVPETAIAALPVKAWLPRVIADAEMATGIIEDSTLRAVPEGEREKVVPEAELGVPPGAKAWLPNTEPPRELAAPVRLAMVVSGRLGIEAAFDKSTVEALTTKVVADEPRERTVPDIVRAGPAGIREFEPALESP